MTISTNFHEVETMRANCHPSGTSWLEIEDGKGNSVTLYMDYTMAQAMQEVWEKCAK